MASLGLGIGLGASAQAAIYAFIVICLAALSAFVAMNPLGAMALLAQLGYFIIKAVFGAIQIVIAGAYWVLKNAVIMIANMFIAVFNAIISIVNWLISLVLNWFGIICDWDPIPYMRYIATEQAPKTIEQIIQEIYRIWQDIQVAASCYWAGASAWAPWSYVVGTSVGAGTGYTGYNLIYKPKTTSRRAKRTSLVHRKAGHGREPRRPI